MRYLILSVSFVIVASAFTYLGMLVERKTPVALPDPVEPELFVNLQPDGVQPSDTERLSRYSEIRAAAAPIDDTIVTSQGT